MWMRAALVVALVVAVATAAGCAGAKTGATAGSGSGDTGPIKVGAVLSLTGQYAAIGKAEQQALDLEVKRINDAGGVNGRQIELVIADDATDEAKAQAATTKLIEQDKVVAILGASGTGQTMAMRGDVDRSGVPQISMAGGTAVTDKFDPLVFQTPWSNRIVVPFVLQAMKSVGITKVGLITDTGGYGKDGRSVIASEAANFGMQIVADETFNPQDTDMSTQLTKIKNSGAEAILMWTAGKDAVTVAKNREQLGVTLPMFGGSGQGRREFIEGAGTAAEGFVFGTGRSLSPAVALKDNPAQSKVVTEFGKRYEAAYKAQPDIFAGHAYDAINILTDSIKRAGTTDSKALRDAIEQTKNLVGFGGSFTYGPSDHNGLTANDLFLYQIENGAWKSAQ